MCIKMELKSPKWVQLNRTQPTQKLSPYASISQHLGLYIYSHHSYYIIGGWIVRFQQNNQKLVWFIANILALSAACFAVCGNFVSLNVHAYQKPKLFPTQSVSVNLVENLFIFLVNPTRGRSQQCGSTHNIERFTFPISHWKSILLQWDYSL